MKLLICLWFIICSLTVYGDQAITSSTAIVETKTIPRGCSGIIFTYNTAGGVSFRIGSISISSGPLNGRLIPIFARGDKQKLGALEYELVSGSTLNVIEVR